jgi:hypothetical protein
MRAAGEAPAAAHHLRLPRLSRHTRIAHFEESHEQSDDRIAELAKL